PPPRTPRSAPRHMRRHARAGSRTRSPAPADRSSACAAWPHRTAASLMMPSRISFSLPPRTAVAGLALGIVIGLIWPVLGSWLTAFGEWITGAGAAGAGIYGVINRLLLPFGLHHIPNSLIWFVFGLRDALLSLLAGRFLFDGERLRLGGRCGD